MIVADNGASIGGEDGDPTVARETAAALGKKAIAFADSVASPGAAKPLVELAIKNFGGIDIVVNNAAILRDAFVFRADPRDWDAVIRNNLSAAFYLINAASRGDARPGQVGPRRRAGRLRLGPHRQHRLVGRPVRKFRPGRLCQRQGRPVRAHARDGDGPRARPDHRQCRGAVRAHARHRHHPAGQRGAEVLQGARAQDRRAPCRQPGDGALLAGRQGHHRPAAGRARPRGLPVRPAAARGARIEAGGDARRRISAPSSSDKFTDLTTDLEAFNTEPLV